MNRRIKAEAAVWNRLRQSPCTTQQLVNDTGFSLDAVQTAMKRMRITYKSIRSRRGAPCKQWRFMTGDQLAEEVRKDTEAGLCE